MKQYLKMGDEFTSEVRCEDGMLVTDDTYYADIHSDGDLICHAINSHDELVEMNKELMSELKAMANAYVNLMESGKDRIERLGGDCDEVAYMAAHDANLVHACSVIGKYDGGVA